MDPYVGEIRIFGFNFAPFGWALCNGQLMAISSNTALFSLLGTTYGGNGQTNFALPDFRAKVPMHFGDGPGLTPRVLGETAGSTSITLNSTNLPQHNHVLQVAESPTLDTGVPSSSTWIGIATAAALYIVTPNTNTNLAPQAILTQGGNLPHENQQPFLTMSFCISLRGVFPPRN
jgi:microcystin-dependent protein